MNTEGGGSRNAPSTCKRSGQLSCSARRRVACGAASARRLDQHAYRGLEPRCRELRGSCGGRAAEKGQVDQGARAHRPLSSFTGSFSPLMIRSSFLTSPPALKKGALNGCALRGACRLISAPGEEVQPVFLGNFGSRSSEIVCFASSSVAYFLA